MFCKQFSNLFVDRFESAEEIQRLSGIAPVTERSGKTCWVHDRFACPKFLRQSFHEFAAQSIGQSPERARITSAGENGALAIRLLSAAWRLDGSESSIAVGKCVFPTANKPINKRYGAVVHR
jgi:hypothetical protein